MTKSSIPAPNPFLNILSSSQIALIGAAIGTFYLSWAISGLPEGAQLLGLIIGTSSIVANVTAVVFSGLIDRGSKKHVLILTGICSSIAAILIVGSWGAGLSNSKSSTIIVSIIAILSISLILCQASQELGYACSEIWLSNTAPDKWMTSRTAALIQGQRPLARLLAPLCAGPFINTGISIAGVVLLITFISQALLLRVSEPHNEEISSSRGNVSLSWYHLWSDAVEAASLIRKSKKLVILLIVSSIGNLVVFPIYSMLSVLVRQAGVVDGDHIYLYVSAAYGGGMVLGAAFMSATHIDIPRKDISSAIVLAGVLSTLLVAVHCAVAGWCFLLLFGFAGFEFMILSAIAGGGWLDDTPRHFRARVFSLRRLVGFLTIPIGTSGLGLLGAYVGMISAIVVLTSLALSAILAMLLSLTFMRPGVPVR